MVTRDHPPGPAGGVPVPVILAVSAVFHYLGPAMAVLLFSRIDVRGVAWLRMASAALVFAAWRHPWRLLRPLSRRPQPPARRRRATTGGQATTKTQATSGGRLSLVLALGLTLAGMNLVFYLAIARLPMATVGSIEFLGVLALAAAGARTGRNLLAVALAAGGVGVLADVRLGGSPLGFALALANCALFMLYVTLAHRAANAGAPDGTRRRGLDLLGAAMLVAAVAAAPLGVGPAAPAFRRPGLLLAAVAVGVCSSVIPYVTDQLAMARLPRSSFALMLCLLPASATVLGALVLRQVPTAGDLLGIVLVTAGLAIHRPTRSGS
ncbi:DMT family transporter [Plantactinospora siamensis]|uniref:DMT family transporter n=1 Tax=Plantactinospora siamensis TaxID=555372 RepID=A0ABV6P2G4_9ACTN